MDIVNIISFFIFFIIQGFTISAPIAYASLGAVFSEKSGVVNIALEGMILISSFFIVWGSLLFQNIWVGLIFAILSGLFISLIHAILSINFKINQIVSGVAINIFAIGISRFLSQRIFGQETQSPPNPYIFPKIILYQNLSDPLKNIEINFMVILLIPITFISWFLLYKTVFGLRLRTVGENPEAADTLGISVYKMRYIGVLLSGFFCALSASALYPSQWVSEMTAGRGFIALGAMIFGRWHPVGSVLASLLFGFAFSFKINYGSNLPIPSQFIQMFPYILALIVLAGLVGKPKPPLADGIPYEKNED